jgi:hypothetical protein
MESTSEVKRERKGNLDTRSVAAAGRATYLLEQVLADPTGALQQPSANSAGGR